MIKIFEHKFNDDVIGKEFLEDLQNGNLQFSKDVGEFENEFQKISRTPYNVGTNSASSAFFILFSFLKEKYGTCNVIFPTLTFTSPAWSAVKNGHDIFFCDIDELSLCMDFGDLIQIRGMVDRRKQTVIVPTLYGGISSLPKTQSYESYFENYKNDIFIMDAAHCTNVVFEYDHITVRSFFPSKPIMMTNGGLISPKYHNVNKNIEIQKYAKSYRNFGRHIPSKKRYDGFKFYMNGFDARLGLKQIDIQDELSSIRESNFQTIVQNVDLPNGYFIFPEDKSNFYIGTFIANDEEHAREIVDSMSKNDIQISTHYPLLHTKEFYWESTYTRQFLPKAEKLISQIINFPIHHNLTDNDLEKIIESLST